MQGQVKSKMKCGFIVCLLVSGLVGAVLGVDDNVESETQESGTSINFRFLDKNKRGAAKITNTDSQSFNHLTASNAAATNSAGFKPSTNTVSASNPTVPFRYIQNQQYYQPNPYFTYVQIPHAAQIAAQYSLQSNPVAHFLQTPTQIQYVAAPTVAHIPQIKYQSFSAGSPSASEGASSATGSQSQYLAQSQHVAQSQYVAQSPQVVQSSQVVQSQQAAQVPASVAATGVKQGQVPLYSDYQQLYYTQQPVFAYFTQPSNYIYQHPNANFLLKQQQQQQIANIFGAHRFGFYTPTQNAQLNYLVPVPVQQAEQDPRTATNAAAGVKSSEKTLSNPQQQTSSTNSYSFGTKA